MIAPGEVPAAPAMPQAHQLGTPAAAQMRRCKNHGGKGARVARTRQLRAHPIGRASPPAHQLANGIGIMYIIWVAISMLTNEDYQGA